MDAVKVPAEVTVPVPVVARLPVVERLPVSLIVKAVTPADWMTKEVLVAALVSFNINALAVPALVKVNEVAVPESVD